MFSWYIPSNSINVGGFHGFAWPTSGSYKEPLNDALIVVFKLVVGSKISGSKYVPRRKVAVPFVTLLWWSFDLYVPSLKVDNSKSCHSTDKWLKTTYPTTFQDGNSPVGLHPLKHPVDKNGRLCGNMVATSRITWATSVGATAFFGARSSISDSRPLASLVPQLKPTWNPTQSHPVW